MMALRFLSRFSFLLRFVDGGGLSDSSGARRKSRLSLHLSEGVLLVEFRSTFVRCVRFV
jgi:hypothetical protein